MDESTSQLVWLLRQQVQRLHGRLAVVESRYRAERAERLEVERELEETRKELEVAVAGRETVVDPSCARRLVEEAVGKAAAATRECADLRAQLREALADKADAEAAERDATSLRRALHNLSASFEEQERQLRASLAESDADLQRQRQTRIKCTDHTQRLAETLRELMITLADEPHSQDGADDDHDGRLADDADMQDQPLHHHHHDDDEEEEHKHD